MADFSGATMSPLPMRTSLGELSLLEVFVEYDGPRVFSCKSEVDQKFLAVWAEEFSDRDVWLYVPVSKARYQMVRSGGIALRDAFMHAEGFVYQVVTPFNSDVGDSSEPLSRSRLSDEWLPEEGFRLDLPTATRPDALTADQIQELAVQEGRGRLSLRVHISERKRTEAPTRKIGELLISTQSVLDNLGNAQMVDSPVQSGMIPQRITDEVASSVVDLRAASFVLDIAPSEGNDLFGDSAFTRAIDELVTLLDKSLPYAELTDRLAALKPRAAKSFRRFVEELESTGGDVSLTAGGKNLGPRSAELSIDELREFVTRLRVITPDVPETITGTMILRMADLDRKKFGFHDPQSGKDLIGDIDPEALAEFSQFQLDSYYKVVISNKGELDPAMNVRKSKFLLEQFLKVDEQSVQDTL